MWTREELQVRGTTYFFPRLWYCKDLSCRDLCVTAHSLIHTGKPSRRYSLTFTTADPHHCIPSRFSDCGSAWTCTYAVLCVSVNSETLEDVCSLGSRRSAAWPICAKTYSQMSKHNHAERVCTYLRFVRCAETYDFSRCWGFAKAAQLQGSVTLVNQLLHKPDSDTAKAGTFNRLQKHRWH